ncbi:hypothetical protein FB451DRAFT_1393924 [Mycena latifolia]|nr:hypothetical protein FB451DRAFT_1393924 [Mycena latifolia]
MRAPSLYLIPTSISARIHAPETSCGPRRITHDALRGMSCTTSSALPPRKMTSAQGNSTPRVQDNSRGAERTPVRVGILGEVPRAGERVREEDGRQRGGGPALPSPPSAAFFFSLLSSLTMWLTRNTEFATDIAALHPATRITLLHSRARLLPRFDGRLHGEVRVSREPAVREPTPRTAARGRLNGGQHPNCDPAKTHAPDPTAGAERTPASLHLALLHVAQLYAQTPTSETTDDGAPMRLRGADANLYLVAVGKHALHAAIRQHRPSTLKAPAAFVAARGRDANAPRRARSRRYHRRRHGCATSAGCTRVYTSLGGTAGAIRVRVPAQSPCFLSLCPSSWHARRVSTAQLFSLPGWLSVEVHDTTPQPQLKTAIDTEGGRTAGVEHARRVATRLSLPFRPPSTGPFPPRLRLLFSLTSNALRECFER